MSRGSPRLPVRYNHVLFVPLPGSGWFKDVTPLGHSGPSAASPSLGGCLDLGDWLELWSWESRQVCKGQPCSALPPRRGWLCDLYEHTLPYSVRSMCCTPSWNTPFLPSQKTCRVTEHVWWEQLPQAVTQGWQIHSCIFLFSLRRGGKHVHTSALGNSSFFSQHHLRLEAKTRCV